MRVLLVLALLIFWVEIITKVFYITKTASKMGGCFQEILFDVALQVFKTLGKLSVFGHFCSV